jgi:hypothetical protein
MKKMAVPLKKIVENERKKKTWNPSDIDLLRLVILLLDFHPSEEQLDWVFDEIREIASMAREQKNKE